MDALSIQSVTCPYCWSGFDTRVDCSAGSQEYYEDCPVCCHPIRFRIRLDAGDRLASVETFTDSE